MDTLPTHSVSGGSKWVLLLLVGAMCILTYTLIVIYGYEFFNGQKKEEEQTKLSASKTSISGSIDLNGAPLEGSSITIQAKKNGGTFQTIVPYVSPIDGAVWVWHDAVGNTEYILQAVLTQDGKKIATSKQLVLIAPADSEVLRINVPTLPQPTATPQVLSAISGTFNINGYIPQGSSISLAARKMGDKTFSPIATNLPALDNTTWSWTEALQNTQYEIQATLISNGTGNTQSQVITVTAPATNELLTLNSTLSSPTPSVVGISGTINLNGYVPPSGSYITIGVRPSGTTQFNQLSTNITAADGSSWTYPTATAGASYDVQAYLWQNNTPFSQSQIVTVSAPATGEVLTINAMTPPSTVPTGNSISISCNSYNSSANLWQITVNYNNTSAIQNAQSYWLTIGTNPGGNQQVNLVTSPTTPNQTQTYQTGYIFNAALTYYAQYAYATCATCNSFSPFSPSYTFTCSTSPTSTPAPSNTPIPTPTYTPIPTPTNTPIPSSPTNTPVPITPINTPTPTR